MKNMEKEIERPKKEMCQRCSKNEASMIHSCPYAEEMADDYSENCNCCPDCTGECCMDI